MSKIVSRARQAALRIQLILEEFTPSELSEGLALLEAAQGEDITMFLLRRLESDSPRKRSRPEHISTLKEKIAGISDLKDVDPEKYHVLREFEVRLRTGDALPSMDNCRAFGKELSKAFDPGKSRKECIPRLLATLASLDLDQLRAAISKASSYGDREGTEPYRRLASHLISGPSDR